MPNTEPASQPAVQPQPAANLPFELAQLLGALVSLDNEQTAAAFLQDLCTPRELEDLSQRLEVARMLDAGVRYACIQAATGASATTVARVARCLKYGSGGYRAILDTLPPYEEDPAGE